MTYLELCQKMVRDLGLQNTIAAVTAQTGMSQKVVDWVADADVYIQSLWKDWNFLWAQHTQTAIIGTRQINKPSALGTWDFTSMYLNYSTDDYTHLSKLDYLDWRANYGVGVSENDSPDRVVELPNHNLYLEPAPAAEDVFIADYWKAPTRMTANSSQTPIPTRFQRIILAQAKIYYAEHDEFPTVYELATKEFDLLLKDLEVAELPGKPDNLRKSQSPGEGLQTVVE